MQTKLASTTITTPIGQSLGHQLHTVSAGDNAGRKVALIGTDGVTIKLTWSDSPYSLWSTLQTLLSDASLGYFDSVIDSNGNIHLVYSEATTINLVYRKLTFSAGSWTAGSKVVIYDGTQCYDPSLVIEPNGTLSVAYASYSAPNRTIYVKSSTDGGVSWGAGSADPGNMFSVSTNAWCKLLLGPNDLYLFATYDLNRIVMYSKPLSGGSFSSGATVISGSGLDNNFDAAVNSDGNIGLVYGTSGLRYKEYDGALWSSEVQVDNSLQTLNPNVFFRYNQPVLTYYVTFDGAQRKQMLAVRTVGKSFNPPVLLDQRSAEYKTVLLYEAAGGTYEDKTSEAASYTSGDLFHSVSGKLMKGVNDAVYLGGDQSFRYTQFSLSIQGAGGATEISYWNGTSWSVITPVTGNPGFDSSSQFIIHFDDYDSIPVDWQKSMVNNISRFWLRIRVITAFTTAPVGDTVSASSELKTQSVER